MQIHNAASVRHIKAWQGQSLPPMLQVLCALQDNGQVRQTVHYAFNVGNAKPCVNQNGSFTPAQQFPPNAYIR